MCRARSASGEDDLQRLSMRVRELKRSQAKLMKSLDRSIAVNAYLERMEATLEASLAGLQTQSVHLRLRLDELMRKCCAGGASRPIHVAPLRPIVAQTMECERALPVVA